MSDAPTIVWLRDDLRVADNPALRAGVDRGAPLVVLYLLDEVSPEVRPLGGASKWWLHHSLDALADDIASRGGMLVLRQGAASVEIPRLVSDIGAGAIYWNRRYGGSRDIDAQLKTDLREAGLDVQSFAANLLAEPWTVQNDQGGPYKVFTPFWRAAREQPVRDLVPMPRQLPAAPTGVASDELDTWQLLPTHPDWAAGLREACDPGEKAAHRRLERFVHEVLPDYHRRDEPGVEATSGLSPHLRFGEISPVQIWHRVHGDVPAAAQRNVAKFLSEVGWREFNHTVLFYNTELATVNVRREYDAFPWQDPDPAELTAWQQGRTGIPLVDAGMRELWISGHMHNRIRMVTASFLIKNLLVDWRIGEQWFWDCLVDADEANNPANWQWVAGSGMDAAPYFRVFNPILQASKFDADGTYVSRWVPEHDTAEYPEPIVDLAQSRRDALSAYEHVKSAK